MHTSIERQVHVEASPEVVFEVISRPEHIREWWPDEADLEPTAGATGEIWFGDRASGKADIYPITVVDTQPPRHFSFRWCYPAGTAAGTDDSLLVTFELEPTAGGTTLRLTETGFREMRPDAAAREELHQSHVEGWDLHLPKLVDYLARLVASR